MDMVNSPMTTIGPSKLMVIRNCFKLSLFVWNMQQWSNYNVGLISVL